MFTAIDMTVLWAAYPVSQARKNPQGQTLLLHSQLLVHGQSSDKAAPFL